jgi:3-phenylpropionate/cinnamic acid dioxygenase small subunit
MPGSFTLDEIERFLIDEAALLDEWRLEEWLALFAEDGHYLVPPLDAPQADHQTTLFLIADDRRNLASRVRQLLGGTSPCGGFSTMRLTSMSAATSTFWCAARPGRCSASDASSLISKRCGRMGN